MEVVLDHIGKRFGREWVVREINELFSGNEHTAILGPNGSGKSTLLKLIASFIIPSEGKVTYALSGQEIPADQVFRHLIYAAPYLDLIDKMTLEELINHHIKFKPFYDGIDQAAALEIMQLEAHRKKQVHSFSSGMKMRVRLALAFLSNTPLILLDEPTSNLDSQGREWYKGLARQYLEGRLAIVCSNHQEEEYFFCRKQLVLP